MRYACTCYACRFIAPRTKGKLLDYCSEGREWYAYYDGVFILVRTGKLVAQRDLNTHVYKHLQLLAQLTPARPRFTRLPKVDRLQLVIQHPDWKHRLERAGYRQAA